jgi:hypothetical protein
MAKIPLPQRGQPMDLSYVYEVAKAVNDISSQMSTSNFNYVSIETPVGKENLKSSETRMVAGYVDVLSQATVSAGNEKEFSYDFPADFKYAPIATATLVNIGNTAAGKDATVVLKSVSTSKVDGVIKFKTSGDLSIGVNLIVIGVPN